MGSVEKHSVKWRVSTNRYVGFIDIMGFKDLVVRKDHNELYEMMQKVSKAISSIQTIFKGLGSTDEEESIAMMMYSDSIMVYSRTDDWYSRSNLIAAMANLSSTLFENKIPFKGAVAFGQMTLDFENSIFFGQPLIDAYLMQQDLYFYGVVIHASAEIEYGHNIDEDDGVFEFDCPFKHGSAEHLTVTPGISFLETYEVDMLNNVYDNVLRLRFNTSGSLRRYIDNTIIYLKCLDAFGRKILEHNKPNKSNS